MNHSIMSCSILLSRYVPGTHFVFCYIYSAVVGLRIYIIWLRKYFHSVKEMAFFNYSICSVDILLPSVEMEISPSTVDMLYLKVHF